MSSFSGLDMARRHQRAPLRNSAGGQGRPSGPSELGVAMAGADEYPLHGSDSQAEADECHRTVQIIPIKCTN